MPFMLRATPTSRSCAALALLAVGAVGCALTLPAGPPPTPLVSQNPAFIPVQSGDVLFNHLVDVVDDYFTIDHEEPVRQVGDVLIEGRIDTFPETGSTLLEPWRGDSVGSYNRLESTLQSIRRLAVVRVIPTGGGFLVDVAVYKELEDVKRPEHATAGAATFRHDGSLKRYTDPVAGEPRSQGWIPQGRDVPLEQSILSELQSRLASPPLRFGF